jgi:hypothetical protein
MLFSHNRVTETLLQLLILLICPVWKVVFAVRDRIMAAKAVKSLVLSCLSKSVGAAPRVHGLVRHALVFLIHISLIVLRRLVGLKME